MSSAAQTRDHNEIRRWVEDRGGIFTVVDGTGGLLRIDFVNGGALDDWPDAAGARCRKGVMSVSRSTQEEGQSSDDCPRRAH
jgi:hypothetical protein